MRIIITPFFLLLLLSRIETNEAANWRPVRSPAPHPGISPSPHPGSGVTERNFVGRKKISFTPPTSINV
ncbi:hypothetical protein H5410_034673 [Solanum commersonii]|uniref:Secreted protein n=1 Tax=Solanum commersonii TaxID=4109 RepID=A0A9J5YU18_SOLCO|nr:hypothetical protein H5410_034673 [Solanum commersonii]